jgi:putative ABC transport system permease protein
VISVPISIYFLDEWLMEYAYHINVNAGSVLITIVLGLVTVLIPVGHQSLKVATANPVESLRYE